MTTWTRNRVDAVVRWLDSLVERWRSLDRFEQRHAVNQVFFYLGVLIVSSVALWFSRSW